jgi:gluconolactonase
MPDALDAILESKDAERLATGFVFTEGPLWHPDGFYYFVDIRRSNLHKLTPGKEPELCARTPARATAPRSTCRAAS